MTENAVPRKFAIVLTEKSAKPNGIAKVLLHGFVNTNPLTTFSAPLAYHIYFILYTLFSFFG